MKYNLLCFQISDRLIIFLNKHDYQVLTILMKENKRYKRLKTAKWISIRKLVPGLLLTVRSAGMGDVISPAEMKSARSYLAPNQNTAFHFDNRAGVLIWRIFIPPTNDLASHRRDLGKRASSLNHMNAMLILTSKTVRRLDHR